MEANGIGPALRERLEDHRAGRATLRETGAAVRELFLRGEFPEETARQMLFCSLMPAGQHSSR